MALTASVQAVPITGYISFSGSAQLNAPTLGASSKVLSWGSNNTVTSSDGSFSGLNGLDVTLLPNWPFSSGALSKFWSVGGFQFNLNQSSVVPGTPGTISVVFAGTVIDNLFDPTAFVGTLTFTTLPALQVVDKTAVYNYSDSLTFTSVRNVPDDGATALLLGPALAGLAWLRRKMAA